MTEKNEKKKEKHIKRKIESSIALRTSFVRNRVVEIVVRLSYTCLISFEIRDCV